MAFTLGLAILLLGGTTIQGYIFWPVQYQYITYFDLSPLPIIALIEIQGANEKNLREQNLRKWQK